VQGNSTEKETEFRKGKAGPIRSYALNGAFNRGFPPGPTVSLRHILENNVPFARTVCTLPSGLKLDSEHAFGKAEADAGILGVRLPQLEIKAWNSMSHGALLPRSGRSAWVKPELT